MKVTGIIAEYNPFHNGHQYHLEEAKKTTDADYLVVIMSGDFTQRGIPALVSKYERAKYALLSGADLVLELPMPYAVSSAEHFALGSCSLLNSLGVIDALCFGMEDANLDSLMALTDIIASEPEEYQALLRQYLSAGISFPKAQEKAIAGYDPSVDCSLLKKPNNRLGIEYLKALHKLGSTIMPAPIHRIGKGYDDTELSLSGRQEFSSASAIRKYITDTDNYSELISHLPDCIGKNLTDLLNGQRFLLNKDLDLLLHYKLLQQDTMSLQTYVDINEDIANKIINRLPYYQGFDAFCFALKSKDLTYTRISRMLLHILLDYKKKDLRLLDTLHHAPYGRILGFRKDAGDLLHAIKEKSSVPLISKMADASKTLSSEAMQILKKDVAASHIYEAILSQKSGVAPANEYTSPLIIL